jgi:hypothetical protein
MSYDLEIACHDRPSLEQVETWAAERGLLVEVDRDEGGAEVLAPGRRDTKHLFQLYGPMQAEPDDLNEQLAAACLAPRWLVTMSIPHSSSKRAVDEARKLARRLAELNGGAAFDPQGDDVFWPRAKRRRVEPAGKDEVISVVELEWFLPPSRWADAPATLVRLLARRAPEALPARYGTYEPPQHRFDPGSPQAFLDFVAEDENTGGFWFAKRPSFGGSWNAPRALGWPGENDLRLAAAHLDVEFDGRVLEADERWREAVADLLAAGAEEMGAFFAAAKVVWGLTVTANYRLVVEAGSTGGVGMRGDEWIRRGELWRGLPPVPFWLTWYGGPYRDLVEPHLTDEALRGNPRPRVERREAGVLVRLADEPRVLEDLGPWPLQATELAYRRGPDGEPAEREDDAPHIPDLETTREASTEGGA